MTATGEAWLQQKERGSTTMIRILLWLCQTFGRGPCRLLLHPICLYFIFFGRQAHEASRIYLSRLFGRPARFREIYRHYHDFSATILDRVFFLGADFDRFEIAIENVEPLLDLHAQGRGCLLLGAHLGSFEVLRALGISHRKLPIKVLMYQENARKMNTVLDALNPEITASVIPLGKPDALMRAKSHVDEGGILAILGDRMVQGDKTVACPFLGKMADFPTGAIALAAVLKVPVILFFGLYLGGNRYNVKFETFSDRVVLPRRNRKAALHDEVRRYAARLEELCRETPYNWFNFYDFWDREK